MASEESFRVFIRRDNAYERTLTVRFQTDDGLGVLGVRKVGRAEPQPTAYHEENDVSMDAFRSGRFVHVLHGGQRQSYALSRVLPDLCERLPQDAWTELRPVTEFGFRYLVIPDGAMPDVTQPGAIQVQVAPPRPQPTPGSAAVAVAVASAVSGTPPTPTPPPSGPVASVPAAAPIRAGLHGSRPPATLSLRPDPVEVPSLAGTFEAARGPTLEAADTRPSRSVDAPAAPRPIPVEAGLAQAALELLSREQAIAYLKAETAKVEALHRRTDDLERQLSRSEERERDLLHLLAKWRTYGG